VSAELVLFHDEAHFVPEPAALRVPAPQLLMGVQYLVKSVAIEAATCSVSQTPEAVSAEIRVPIGPVSEPVDEFPRVIFPVTPADIFHSRRRAA
jgi:hypothetical protein